MSQPYSEPLVSFLVLDFRKPLETRLLLESLKRHVKFDHRVIYLHNGPDPDGHAHRFYGMGLVDQFIQTSRNNGLGIGTRDLFAACFSEYACYTQNDHVLGRDFTQDELSSIIAEFGVLHGPYGRPTMSISLAGDTCSGLYSERAHLIKTSFYREMEHEVGLPSGGAGPFHDHPWREGAIQALYEQAEYLHWIYPRPLFIDNGQTAERQNPDGSRWRHFPDTKQCWLLEGPVKERFVYPKFTDQEWEAVISTQSWPAGQIPDNEVKDSFRVPGWHQQPR